MKAHHVGFLSALIASVCCVGPVLFVLAGLGTLGLGALLGRYHWWFLIAAAVLLSWAWRAYLHERRRCQTARCEMVRGKTTKRLLFLTTVIVAFFAGVNLYTYAGLGHGTPPPAAAGLTEVVIPVEGMTCATCELTVESSLKHLPGVAYADARVTDHQAVVHYDAAQVTLEQLLAAINQTGYRASQPKEQ